jgi:WD40 repeat protein
MLQLSIKHRLELQPKNRVTVVKSGKLEVISGDHAGYVTIFWLKTETIIQQCKAHNTSVVDLEFDATKIVSCGMDGCVKVIDVTSCEIIHSIRGQDGPILSCRFDEDKIVTLTKDGQVRHWMWQSRVDPYKNGETYHRISSGETVASIATFYGIPIVNLVKWNVNQDMKKIHVGQRLIVSKTQQGNSTTTEYAQSTKSGPNRITSDASFLPSSKLHGHRMRPNPAEDTSKKTAMTEIKTGPENIHDIRCEKTLVGSRLARSEFNGY